MKNKKLFNNSSRRKFIKASAVATTGYWVAGGIAPRESRSALEEIRFGCVGIGGSKGQSDSADAERNGKIVAVCDIDDNFIAKRKETEGFEDAVVFNDYRKMFDQVGKSIDAVTVTTPDHTHAVVAAMAMRNGKAVYCQKPLTRTIFEARTLAELAASSKVVTQMGNQGSDKSGLREATAKVKAGVIGEVKEVHVWTNRPVWPQGIERPVGEPVPAHIHWDEFLGPVEAREYNAAYHPFKWRGFWAFGTGALGDMACHTMNMPFAACEMVNPIAVQATTSGHNGETYPGNSKITFDFGATESRPPLKFFWYDGGNKIAPELIEGRKRSDSGLLIVGTNGKLFSPNDYGAEYEIIGGADKEVDFVRSPGHFKEFANAIKANKPEACWSNFANYAGKLTEVILLGNLAVWAAGRAKEGVATVESPRLEWDQANMKVVGTNEYDDMIKAPYRAGYEL